MIVLGLVAARAQSQGAPTGATTNYGHQVPVPSVHAVRRTTPVVIDGVLNEAAWSAATPTSGFRQVDPNEGAPATQRTVVRFLVDDDAIYIGAKLYSTDGRRGVRPQLARRDVAYDADWFEIAFDTFHDHVRRVFISVTPSGSKNDETGTGTSCCDPGWDPVWEVATHIDDDGWTVEFRIPFSQLHMPRDSVQTWGLQLKRVASATNETSLWAFWRRDEAGGAPRYGHLEDIHIAPQPRHAEILPYVVTREKAVAFEPGDPFHGGNGAAERVGVDLKYSITPNLALAATVNPDFGQVEVDPASINLSAFETFFAEKRPFFVEGAGAFRFGNSQCNACSNFQGVESFYPRRIGRAPTATALAQSAGPFADIPEASTILGAAKVIGRTGGVSVGLLDAVTNREDARVQLADGSRTSVGVEPLSNYFVGRATSDYRDGTIVTGLYASSVVRSLDTTLAPLFNRHSEMAGADLEAYWDERRYSVLASAMYSNVGGSSQDLVDRQQTSARYYQRPDGGRGVDSTATSLQGAGAYVRVAKDGGDWTWEGTINTRTPGYEVNDIAFQERADFIQTHFNLSRFWNTPTAVYRRITVTGGAQYERNFQGLRTDAEGVLNVSMLTPNFWEVDASATVRPSVLDDRLLRGGPAAGVPATRTAELIVSTNPEKSLTGNVDVAVSRDALGGYTSRISAGVSARPRSNITVAVSPALSRVQSALQYITAVADPTATAFFGNRYVLADLAQTTLSMDMRLDLTLSPTLTFELYTQPLVGSGTFAGFKEFRQPRSGDLNVYGRDAGTVTPLYPAASPVGSLARVAAYRIDPDGAGPAQPFTIANPDFNTRSLRGNAVVRWEYRPGSTLYLAWTQTRGSDASTGAFDFARDTRTLVATRPDNIFLVKASWWWAR